MSAFSLIYAQTLLFHIKTLDEEEKDGKELGDHIGMSLSGPAYLRLENKEGWKGKTFSKVVVEKTGPETKGQKILETPPSSSGAGTILRCRPKD